jgi:hypothetical protein
VADDDVAVAVEQPDVLLPAEHQPLAPELVVAGPAADDTPAARLGHEVDLVHLLDRQRELGLPTLIGCRVRGLFVDCLDRLRPCRPAGPERRVAAPGLDDERPIPVLVGGEVR